jgi:hypothetical protein
VKKEEASHTRYAWSEHHGILFDKTADGGGRGIDMIVLYEFVFFLIKRQKRGGGGRSGGWTNMIVLYEFS